SLAFFPTRRSSDLPAGAARHEQENVRKDRGRGVQRVEADAAAARGVDWIGEQVVHVDQPAGQHPQCRPAPLRRPERTRDREGQGSVQQEVGEGAGIEVGHCCHPATTRSCSTASTEQPHDSRLPCRATGWPSTRVVASPSTITWVPLCFGQLAVSLTRATGLPSISVKGEPVTTVPPLLVGSPTTIHIRVIAGPFLWTGPV